MIFRVFEKLNSMMECDSQPGTGSDVNQGAMEEEKYWREYWNRYDDNVAVDHNIQRWTYETRLAMDELLKDAELNCLHHQAVEWHQKRIAHLRGSTCSTISSIPAATVIPARSSRNWKPYKSCTKPLDGLHLCVRFR